MHIVRSRRALPLLPTLLLTFALGACAQQPPAVPVAPPPPMIANQCDEAAAQYVVGKSADAKLAEEVRVKARAQRVRMIHPGQMVTMEFDAGRLTLDVDASGKIVRARCG